MDIVLIIVVATILILIIVIPMLFLWRRSSDIRLEGDVLVFRYPFRKEEINLASDLKSWHLQEAYFLRLGKVYAINMELRNSKWKTISSRFNADSFTNIFRHLESKYDRIRKEDKK